MDTDNANMESIEEFSENCYSPTFIYKDIVDYTGLINFNSSDAERLITKGEINDILNSTGFALCFLNVTDATPEVGLTGANGKVPVGEDYLYIEKNASQGGVGTTIFPNIKIGNNLVINNYRNIEQSYCILGIPLFNSGTYDKDTQDIIEAPAFGVIYDFIKSSPYVYKITFQPFTLLKQEDINEIVVYYVAGTATIPEHVYLRISYNDNTDN
jgi:hypothetical protein